VSKKTILLVEGDTDEALMKPIIEREGLSPHLELHISHGKEKLLDHLPALIKTFSIVGAAIDLNEGDEERLYQSVQTRLQPKFEVTVVQPGVLKVDQASLIVIPLGLPGDQELAGLGISRHSIDDYILRILLMDDRTVESLSEGRLRGLSLKEVIQKQLSLLRGQGLDLTSSKEVLLIAKAVMGFRASDATLAGKVAEIADVSLLNEVASGLMGRIRQLVV
jgi:hypothetical protein